MPHRLSFFKDLDFVKTYGSRGATAKSFVFCGIRHRAPGLRLAVGYLGLVLFRR
jgi:hypothetical protein